MATKAQQAAWEKAYRARHCVAVRAKRRARYLAEREKVLANRKAERVANRDEINARQRARYAEQIEARRAYGKAWYATHRETKGSQKKAARAKFPDRLKAQRRTAYAKHPDRLRQQWIEQVARRRALKLQTKTEKINYKKILRDANGLCGICKQPFNLFGIQFDHIIPLARGGTHTNDNLQATHAICNQRKWAHIG